VDECRRVDPDSCANKLRVFVSGVEAGGRGGESVGFPVACRVRQRFNEAERLESGRGGSRAVSNL
jgi:hypothetical protein